MSLDFLKRNALVAGLGALGLAVGSIFAFSGKDETLGASTSIAAVAQTVAATGAVSVADGARFAPFEGKGYALGDILYGDPNAPVTVIEYASTTCPHCATFHNSVLPEFKERYIDTGKANMIVREIYFSASGLWPSVIARCGGAESFHPMLDAIFLKQAEWTRATDPLDELKKLARTRGMPNSRIDGCLRDRDFAVALAEWSQEHAQNDQVPATPFFVIGDVTLRGVRSADELGDAVDAQTPR